MKIISDVLEIHETTAVSSAVVNERWPLYCDGKVNSLVLIEGVAQTAAIAEGYKRKQKGLGSIKGWLVGVKNAEFKVQTIPLNTRVTIIIESKDSLDNYGVVKGTVKSDDAILAQVTLQAITLNEDHA